MIEMIYDLSIAHILINSQIPGCEIVYFYVNNRLSITKAGEKVVSS